MRSSKRSKSPEPTRSDQYERDNAKRLKFKKNMDAWNLGMQEARVNGTEADFATRNKKPIRPFGLSADPLPKPSSYIEFTDNVAKAASQVKDHVSQFKDSVVKKIMPQTSYEKAMVTWENDMDAWRIAIDAWNNDMKVWEAAKDAYAVKNNIYGPSTEMTKEQYDRWMKEKNGELALVKKQLIEQKYSTDRPGIHSYDPRTVKQHNNIIDEIDEEERKFQPFYDDNPQPVKPEKPEEPEKESYGECDEEGVCVISGGKTRKAKKSKAKKSKKYRH